MATAMARSDRLVNHGRAGRGGRRMLGKAGMEPAAATTASSAARATRKVGRKTDKASAGASADRRKPGSRCRTRRLRSAASSAAASAALSSVRPARVRGVIGARYHPTMPANRDAPLLARQALDGSYALLTFAHAETAQARAGQFVMIKAGTSADPPLRRPFSVMDADPAAGTFRLFLKAVGAGSRALAAMEPGEVAQCLGPLGQWFT